MSKRSRIHGKGIGKMKYRVTNWREYNKALKNRGSLTLWLGEDFDKGWMAQTVGSRKRGRPLVYSEACIILMLVLRHNFRLTLRQVVGFVESLISMTGKDLPVPEFSRLSRRATECLCSLDLASMEGSGHVVIDSSGLKVFGEREWLENKHGLSYQRKVWRKLHIAINGNREIVAREMTPHHVDDRACVESLLEQTRTEYIDDLLADGGYDSHRIYDTLEHHRIRPVIVAPVTAVTSGRNPPGLRDKTISCIRRKGYWYWHRQNDYGRRNRVENTFYRLKPLFGRKLMFRKMDNQNAETHIMCVLLNKMTKTGPPKSVRIA